MTLQALFKEQRYYEPYYKKKLNLDNQITFGCEIEYHDNDNCHPTEQFLEPYVEDAYVWSPYVDGECAEIATPIMTDNKNDWEQLLTVLNLLQEKGAMIDELCGSHVNIGAQILGLTPNNWIRFLTLWMLYEDIIYRFSYGEHTNYRKNLVHYAKPLSKRIYSQRKQEQFLNKPWKLNQSIYEGVNCKKVDSALYNRDNVIEIRVPNGTLNPIIIQINVLFFSRLLEYSASNHYDKEYIQYQLDRFDLSKMNLKYYSNIQFEKAVSLGGLIFQDNEELISFLSIYMKEEGILKQLRSKNYQYKIRK